MYVYIMRFLHV